MMMTFRSIVEADRNVACVKTRLEDSPYCIIQIAATIHNLQKTDVEVRENRCIPLIWVGRNALGEVEDGLRTPFPVKVIVSTLEVEHTEVRKAVRDVIE